MAAADGVAVGAMVVTRATQLAGSLPVVMPWPYVAGGIYWFQWLDILVTLVIGPAAMWGLWRRQEGGGGSSWCSWQRRSRRLWGGLGYLR